MTFYTENDENTTDDQTGSDGEMNTMAVLNTLGGDEVTPEGEPLGLDPEAGQSKLSGSTLAVGVVVVLGAVALLGMKLSLGSIAGGADPSEAEAAIGQFISLHEAAQKTGADGPIKPADEESERVLEELKQNPTDHQVPAEEVQTNPFDISGIVAQTTTDGGTGANTPAPDSKAAAKERARRVAAKFKIDAISGNVVFINGDRYRIGEPIGNSGFVLESVEGLTCVVRTTDAHRFGFVLKYR